MMRRLLLMGIFGLLCSSSVFAQLYDNAFTVSWNPVLAVSNENFTSGFSTRGLRVGYEKFIGDQFSAGLEFGSNSFEKYLPRQTYEFPGGAITTDYQNYASVLTLAATGDYYFKTEGKLIPFAALGLGVGYTTYDQYYNAYSSRNTKTGFMARPSAGVMLRAKDYSRWGIKAGLHADYVSATFDELDAKNFFNIGFTIGVTFLED